MKVCSFSMMERQLALVLLCTVTWTIILGYLARIFAARCYFTCAWSNLIFLICISILPSACIIFDWHIFEYLLKHRTCNWYYQNKIFSCPVSCLCFSASPALMHSYNVLYELTKFARGKHVSWNLDHPVNYFTWQASNCSFALQCSWLNVKNTR